MHFDSILNKLFKSKEKMINILIGFEYSGTFRNAFNSVPGFNAVSCDLLPSDSRENHLTGDIFKLALSPDKIKFWDAAVFFPHALT